MRSESQRNALLVAVSVILAAIAVGILLPIALGGGQPVPRQVASLPT